MTSGPSAKGAAIRIITGFVVMTALLFGTAGTFKWPEAWFYLILQFSFSVSLSIWLSRNDTELLKDRMTFMKKTAKRWDKTILLISILFIIPYMGLPGLDAVRYQWSSVSLPGKAASFSGIIASFTLIFLVMRENTFLSRVVEIQKERGHRVITTGPYRYVRHPMYVGVIILFFSIPISLGSLWTLIPTAALTVLIIVRTYLEDKMLHSELEGYEEYAEKVQYRLVPGIW